MPQSNASEPQPDCPPIFSHVTTSLNSYLSRLIDEVTLELANRPADAVNIKATDIVNAKLWEFKGWIDLDQSMSANQKDDVKWFLASGQGATLWVLNHVIPRIIAASSASGVKPTPNPEQQTPADADKDPES